MKIVAYQAKYRVDILNLWNQTMSADPLSEERFFNTIILDYNFDPELSAVALIDEQVVGFIWSTVRLYPYGKRGLEKERGWIAGLCVDIKQQRGGIGTALVQHAEAKMLEKGVQRITLGAYSPNYLFPGVDVDAYQNALPFFAKCGYEVTGEAVSMERSLFDFTLTDKYLALKKAVEAAGFRLICYETNYAEPLIAFLHAHFDGGWSTNVKNSILAGSAKETIFLMLNQSEEIVGYSQRAIDGTPDRFGPFGVRQDLRGYKLGVVLFNEMLFDMKKRGIYHTYFLWTHGKAQQFYEKNGMKVYRSYHLMNKQLAK
ncbi:GNAT family N-acetyltransferase [Listeria ivanovii]|uniref:GNAT family N-acetyltransferase n=1 Tax=Listeria ivanovii TaxID=1638 RepID=UPI000DA7FAA6|nr:GNAT family N-acetyltransferase [Listeria ivanovii]PZF89010.1 GNAT family N-acetyltransferase [Listeria ivanovii]PZF94302.1 GNAT family N-acetyltransferase [Listeria ivanovii]PZG05013.1 GNAT family N-acetyltransferase [Listeria ivanovii]PZG09474.1 GNAT family N-acetyltransferase [Listeria ivanovii]PZG26375.1 GNAT family N-acetyltransferase [Listeria ivanovii]